MQRILAAALLGLLLAPAAVVAEGAHLGVILGTVDDDAMKKLDYVGRGAYVMNVVEDSPAAKAGMKDRDIIIQVDKDVIIGPGHLKDVLALHNPGDDVIVTVWRKGTKEALRVTLGKPEKKAFISLDPGDIAKTIVISGEPDAWLGVRTQELSEQLGEHFGSKEGVLISEVIDGSPAAKAGLAAGDVIIEIGKEPVGQPYELTKVIADQEPGDKVAVVFIRDGKELTKEVELGETPEKYRKRMPQIFGWQSDGSEGGNWDFDFLKGLPQRTLPGGEALEFEEQSRHEELQQELKELQKTLSEEMKALRAELDELKKNLKHTS